jgi:hypothetical protein
MHRDPQQHACRSGRAGDTGPAIEDHGRVVTTNNRAAAYYRQAQQALDSAQTLTALLLAVETDPAFGLAVADLDAISDAPPTPIRGRQTNWERHHIEIVRTAAAGEVSRAADLLREHLASIGCDPLAIRIVADLRRRSGARNGFEHLAGELPGCHPSRWTASET